VEGNEGKFEVASSLGFLSAGRALQIADRLTACMNCSMQKPHARDIFCFKLSTCRASGWEV
jgi:hypothetical protein